MNQVPAVKPRRRRLAALWTASLLASFFVGIGAQAASAVVESSNWGYFTVAGNAYRNYAVIITSPGNARASTNTGPQSGYTVPGGYVGSRGRLMIDGGTTLSCEGSNTYNSGSISYATMLTGVSCTRYTSGAWYSWGVSLGWNGSGYNSVYTYQTVSQNS